MEFEKHIKIRQERFGAVIFDTLREKVFVTSHTGGQILQLILKGKSNGEITADLKEVYDDSSETLCGDITGFIASLRENNILA